MCPVSLSLLPFPYLVMPGDVRDSSILSGQEVLDLVDGIVFAVNSTNQQVVGDVVQVATELKPRACSADVVSGALALHLGVVGREERRMV